MNDSNLFIASNGDLHDTSTPNWHEESPLREKYRYHFRNIKNTTQLKATLRAGSSTSLGGYPLYFITSDGGALSFESVRSELSSVLDSIKNDINDGWKVIGCDVNYEDQNLFCDHSNQQIESAY